MNQTPVLEIGEDLVLNPATRKVLPQVIDAHNEDPEGTLAALPWLKEDIEFSPQIADLLKNLDCLLYTSPSPRDLSTSRMPSSA